MNSLQAPHSASDISGSLKAKPINNIKFKTLRVAQILKTIRIKMTTNLQILKDVTLLEPSSSLLSYLI